MGAVAEATGIDAKGHPREAQLSQRRRAHPQAHVTNLDRKAASGARTPKIELAAHTVAMLANFTKTRGAAAMLRAKARLTK